MFDAEEPAINGVVDPAGNIPPPATPEQIGRLQNVLQEIAGTLRGESSGVLMTQVDSNPQDSQGQVSNATYSDSVVNTQRGGTDQRYYIVVPYDVQQGSFQLVISIAGFKYTTGVINMPSNTGAPGQPIEAGPTATNIATAIDAVLGTIWPQGTIPTNGALTCGWWRRGSTGRLSISRFRRSPTAAALISKFRSRP